MACSSPRWKWLTWCNVGTLAVLFLAGELIRLPFATVFLAPLANNSPYEETEKDTDEVIAAPRHRLRCRAALKLEFAPALRVRLSPLSTRPNPLQPGDPTPRAAALARGQPLRC